jgi:raffinose/stachyose/melibiose transport system substrate-binding protein
MARRRWSSGSLGAAASKANSSSGNGLGDALGWFPFPTVDGGAGNATDAVGGTNGIAVGKNAPPEAIDFLHYLVSVDNQKKLGADNIAIPTTVGAESSVVDPQLQAVIEARGKAQFVQLYLDQATSPALGAAINDATASLIAGTSTPEQTCQAITDAATSQ